MKPKQMTAVIILVLLTIMELAQARLGSAVNRNRLLGRWTFDEPCIAGPVLYENPAEGMSVYDASLRHYSRINGRMYEDEAFTLPTTVYSDVVCTLIAPNHNICNYYMIDDTVGVFSLFSGIAKLEFRSSNSSNRSNSKSRKGGSRQVHRSPVGTARYVYQGGSDLHSGILGRVITVYEEGIIKHDFCVQGSTYDHIVPPLK